MWIGIGTGGAVLLVGVIVLIVSMGGGEGGNGSTASASEDGSGGGLGGLFGSGSPGDDGWQPDSTLVGGLPYREFYRHRIRVPEGFELQRRGERLAFVRKRADGTAMIVIGTLPKQESFDAAVRWDLEQSDFDPEMLQKGELQGVAAARIRSDLEFRGQQLYGMNYYLSEGDVAVLVSFVTPSPVDSRDFRVLEHCLRTVEPVSQ